MVAIARAELKPFAEERAPTVRGSFLEHLFGFFVLAIYIFRVPLACVRLPHKFLHQLTQIGQADRLALLLVVASFDEQRDGFISENELKEFNRRAEQICADFIASLPNLAVASSIIMGATHMHSMGRPVTWTTQDRDFAGEYGLSSAQVLLWLTYGVNISIECLAVTVMANAYWYRLIVTLYTSSTAERVCFMLRSNAIGIIANLTGLLFFSILLLIGLAGLLNQGSEGWLAVAALPVGLLMCTSTLAPGVVSSHRRMHAEARRLLSESLALNRASCVAPQDASV